MNITLRLTCPSCPEQYEALEAHGKRVGYLRLRHGWFRVDYPDVGGKTIYEVYPRGYGRFEDDERDFYLAKALEAIRLQLATTDETAPPEVPAPKR